MATRRLTFYLFNEQVKDFDGALAPDKSSTPVELASAQDIDGRFYRVPSHPRTPDWVPYVSPILAGDLAGLETMSASGLLLLRVSNRVFGLTFGYGRSLLDLSKIEHQFGLRVALNCIDPAQLRSLDTKTFEDLVVTTTTQVSQSAELPTFGIDVSTDILRGVTGEPVDKSLAKRISGSDALVMNVERDARELPEVCGTLLEAYGARSYQENFGWIDHLAQVRDPAAIANLDDLLVADLRNGTTASTHLALPEAIDWEDIDAFKIAGTATHEYDDLDLDEYLDQLGAARQDLTFRNLRSRRVSVRFARADSFDERWTLYRCIVSEQRLDGQLYVLIEGRWFAVSESLVAQVDQFLGTLSMSKVVFPSARPGEVEKEYNARLADSLGPFAVNLDTRIKRPGGAASGIEVCDVLTQDGEFIHVKRKSRSATLSHLFAQGSVSGTTFLVDGKYRDEIRAEIDALVPEPQKDRWLQLIPDATMEVDRTQNYRVTYAVLANSTKTGTEWLPFFSKLNLVHNSRQLRSIGFQVSVVRIPVSLDVPQTDDP